jgi:hypothetical protein
MPFLPTRTKDEHAKITADYMPNGPHLKAKRVTTSVFYKFLRGLSVEFGRLEGYISDATDGRILTKSTQFLDEWENALGIPDDCFPKAGTAEERRRHAELKLSAEGAHTAEDFERLALILGYVIEVYPGHDFWDPGQPGNSSDPRFSFASEKESRFTIIFEMDPVASEPQLFDCVFPVDFPWNFCINNYAIMQCFFDTIIPANVNGIYLTKSTAERYGYGFFPFGISPYGY